MKPLQSIAMGFVLLVLETRLAGFDVYADPLGWLLVLLGVRNLPADLPLRGPLAYVGGLAALVSLPLWVPAVARALDDADPALAWAADLPRFGFWLLLCLALARAAGRADDRRPAAWFRTTSLGVVAVIVLPVLIFGADATGLDDAAGAVVALVPVALVLLLFLYAARAWAGPPHPESPARTARTS